MNRRTFFQRTAGVVAGALVATRVTPTQPAVVVIPPMEPSPNGLYVFDGDPYALLSRNARIMGESASRRIDALLMEAFQR